MALARGTRFALVTLLIASTALAAPVRRGTAAGGLSRAAFAAAARPGALPALPTAPGAQRQTIGSIPDGSGGTYVAWVDFRDGTSDVYLLRVTNAGGVQSGWPATGLLICNATFQQLQPFLIPDGSNGVIVVWEDERNSWVYGEYWAQRVNASGTVLWAANGVKVGSGFITKKPAVAPDGTGGVLFAWSKGSPGDIYALRLDASGSIPAGWTATGTLVCSDAADQANPVIAGIGSGASIVGWEDARLGAHIFGQKLDASSAAQWTADGIQLDAATYAVDPAITPDGSGGAFLCWYEASLGTLVRGQHIDGTGAPQWGGGAGTDLSGAISEALLLQLTASPDGLGGMIATWMAFDDLGNQQIVVQRANGEGAVQWGTSGASLASYALTQFSDGLDVAPDPTGGGYFTWREWDAASIFAYNLRAQRVTSGGSVSWTPGGLLVGAPAFSLSTTPSIAPDNSGGALVAWVDYDAAEIVTVLVQRYDSGGSPQLGSGAKVFDDPGVQYRPITVADGSDGAWVAYMERSNGQEGIRARHVTSGGVSAGPTIDISSAAGDHVLAGAISDGLGGIIIGWDERYGSGSDVHAQRLDSVGVPQWGASGLTLCDAANQQWLSSLTTDQANGAIFAWSDARNQSGDFNWDIFAQRVTAGGTPLWGANGIALCTDTDFQFAPYAVTDGASGAIVAWTDNRPGGGTYGQKVNAAGTIQWAPNGISVAPLISAAYSATVFRGAVTDGAGGVILETVYRATDPTTFVGDSSAIVLYKVDGSGTAQWGSGITAFIKDTWTDASLMAPDGSHGTLLAWADGRNGPFDIYMQHVNAAGSLSYAADGLPVCTATGWQDPSSIYASSGGDLTIAWSDERSGLSDVYAQRINAAGSAVWTPNGVPICTLARGQYGLTVDTDNGTGAVFSWIDYRSGSARYIYSQHLDSSGFPTWTTDGLVPVLISLVSATAVPGRVRIEWSVAAGEEVTVYRNAGEAGWSAMGQKVADASGRVTIEDGDVVARGHYGYRLGLRQGDAEAFGGETWIDVPATAAFALRAPRPNPVVGSLRVSFSLATGERASLELLDVTGRVVMTRDLAGFEPGDHLLTLERGLPEPGVYFLRLTQGRHTEVKRTVVMD